MTRESPSRKCSPARSPARTTSAGPPAWTSPTAGMAVSVSLSSGNDIVVCVEPASVSRRPPQRAQ